MCQPCARSILSTMCPVHTKRQPSPEGLGNRSRRGSERRRRGTKPIVHSPCVIRSEEFGNLAAIGMSLGDQLRELDEEFLKFAGRFERGQLLGQCGVYRGYGRLRLGGP
jgi:hypothetical protein